MGGITAPYVGSGWTPACTHCVAWRAPGTRAARPDQPARACDAGGTIVKW
jgi:hypothetical protein